MAQAIENIGGEYENRTRVHGFAIGLHLYFQILINVLSGVKTDVYESVYKVSSLNAVLFVAILGANIKNFMLAKLDYTFIKVRLSLSSNF
jgi:hypothetical protein